MIFHQTILMRSGINFNDFETPKKFHNKFPTQKQIQIKCFRSVTHEDVTSVYSIPINQLHIYNVISYNYWYVVNPSLTYWRIKLLNSIYIKWKRYCYLHSIAPIYEAVCHAYSLLQQWHFHYQIKWKKSYIYTHIKVMVKLIKWKIYKYCSFSF